MSWDVHLPLDRPADSWVREEKARSDIDIIQESTFFPVRNRVDGLGDRDVLPVERVPVPPAWQHDEGRPAVTGLDNCFDGWDGRATVAWPRRGWRLELRASAPFRHAVVYTPPGRDYLCVEPVSHANGTIAETKLAAGATLSGTIDFRLSLS